MAVIFSIFAFYTYHNSRKIIEHEFTSANQQDLQNVVEHVDGLIMETRYLIATLITNENMRFFYASANPEAIWSNYSTQIRSQLRSLASSREAIESIYLYSEASDTIYSQNGHFNADTFTDRYWLDQLNADQNGFSIFPYASKGYFPYVLCVAKSFTMDGYNCAAAIMLDLSKFPIIKSINENDSQSIFLISDNQEIIHRYQQDALTEQLDVIEELRHYQPDTDSQVLLVDEHAGAYTFAQFHSETYPWSYVLVTNLTSYTARLSAQNALLFVSSTILILFAILFAVFFAGRFFKPIKNLRDFLEAPNSLASAQITDSEDIKYIAGQITQYIQTNHLLREELEQRLDLLNQSQILALQSQINPHFLSNTLNMIYMEASDTLGFEHPLPLMILDTSKVIRYAIEPEKMVTLKMELDQTEPYLNVLKRRYEKNIVIIQDIQSDILNAKVPRLFIQPIIENAVFHGFSSRSDAEHKIIIRCFQKQRMESADSADLIYVQILNNGNSIPPEKLDELRNTLRNLDRLSGYRSIGLQNVVQRMNLIYSDQFSLDIESNPDQGTCFTMCFPYIE